ncbi:hypothetical protein PALI_a0244 [Pseudoalteromonas aliena SW19]|uniref:Uncharacterized protein n=1 Tax=Pseudoalteromonas aliena SW19 TaxID=1314866 RepID=A0ABR9DZJ0_9GAMM|nr:hypothetical protein [Pseudoalteromonas aliena SW19]
MDAGKGREQDAEALLGFYLAHPRAAIKPSLERGKAISI